MGIKTCTPLAILFVVLVTGDLASVTAQNGQQQNGMFHIGNADGKQIWGGLLMPRTLKLTWQNADRHCKSKNMRLISAPFSQEVKDVLSILFHPLGFVEGENKPMFWNMANMGNFSTCNRYTGCDPHWFVQFFSLIKMCY